MTDAIGKADIINLLPATKADADKLMLALKSTDTERFALENYALRAQVERMREALQTILANTEPDAIKHRDYDHLATDIADAARAALE